jgi:anthranilate phosphoribosyltransferase
VLEGEEGPARTAVLLAAGSALAVSEHAGDLATGAEMAAAAIDRGDAARTLALWIRLSSSRAAEG